HDGHDCQQFKTFLRVSRHEKNCEQRKKVENQKEKANGKCVIEVHPSQKENLERRIEQVLGEVLKLCLKASLGELQEHAAVDEADAPADNLKHYGGRKDPSHRPCRAAGAGYLRRFDVHCIISSADISARMSAVAPST